MKKMMGLLFAVFMITACGAAILQSRTADVKFNNHQSRTADVKVNNHQYSIYVKAIDHPSYCDISLYVNDSEIAKGTVNMNRTTTILSGKYNGTRIEAECFAVATGGLSAAQKCIIFVAGKKVDELSY
jgi:hypothetical protein